VNLPTGLSRMPTAILPLNLQAVHAVCTCGRTVVAATIGHKIHQGERPGGKNEEVKDG
jgi:hypothetical protein